MIKTPEAASMIQAIYKEVESARRHSHLDPYDSYEVMEVDQAQGWAQIRLIYESGHYEWSTVYFRPHK